MEALHFFLFKKENKISLDGVLQEISQNSIVITDQNILPIKKEDDELILISCRPDSLRSLYHELIVKSEFSMPHIYSNLPVFNVFKVDGMIIKRIEELLVIEKNFAICFLFLYCLGMDKQLFSTILCQFIGSNTKNTLIDFFEKNYTNQWPVAKFAKELGVSPQKLNGIFGHKHGMSVKRWLTEKRLKKGAELLLTTTLKVADIARQCGFNSHAHFTTLFGRRFSMCPALFRASSALLAHSSHSSQIDNHSPA